MILNTWTSSETSHSFNFPFTPPHVLRTLNESQMQGMCLNPYLRNRFELCNIGCTAIKSEAETISLFLQNSIGTDIAHLLRVSFYSRGTYRKYSF